MVKTASSDEQHIRYCLGCGYDLRLLQGTRCPECGRSFDPDDDTPYLRPRYDARELAIEVLTGFGFAFLMAILRSAFSFIVLVAILVWQGLRFNDALRISRREPGRIDRGGWMKPAMILQAILLLLLVPLVILKCVQVLVLVFGGGLH